MKHTPPLHYPFAIPPTVADEAFIQVAEDIFWMRFPLPFALDHVHAWVLKDSDGWFIVDTGFNDEQTKATWDLYIQKYLNGKITGVLVTHSHPDHVGCAGHFYEKYRPQLYFSTGEWFYTKLWTTEPSADMQQSIAQHYTRMGLSDDTRQLISSRSNYRSLNIPDDAVTLVKNGDIININQSEWHVITGGGHSAEQISLYNPARKIYIAADQILPTITPNISTWFNAPEQNSLQEFFDSLNASKTLHDDSFILPSHGLPFFGLHTRVDEILHHHDRRLEQISGICAVPHTIASLMQTIFRRPLDRTQTLLGMGEILAHCNYLVGNNTLRRFTDENGAWRFERV